MAGTATEKATDKATAGIGELGREHLVHALYEAAELEHNLMCTYLYAAFSLKIGNRGRARPEEAEAVARWRKAIIDVAIDEMGHLAAVWNITAALGGQPRFGRGNFPLDPGYLPAGIVVKLAPFSGAVLQHFIHLERPSGSDEPDGEGFSAERQFTRGSDVLRLTPMGFDYETVGDFYHQLGDGAAELFRAGRRKRRLLWRSGAAARTGGDRSRRRQTRHLPQDGAAGVRRHRRAGRGRI